MRTTSGSSAAWTRAVRHRALFRSCGHRIVQREAMIEDTHRDPRFADNPLVTGEPHLRPYVGVLIVEGHGVGALWRAGSREASSPVITIRCVGLRRGPRASSPCAASSEATWRACPARLRRRDAGRPRGQARRSLDRETRDRRRRRGGVRSSRRRWPARGRQGPAAGLGPREEALRSASRARPAS